MDIGAWIFFTEYSISPAELGVALEGRDFEEAGANLVNEEDLDQGRRRISRQNRRFPADEQLAQAGAEASSAGHRRRRFPPRGAARAALRRRNSAGGGERRLKRT